MEKEEVCHLFILYALPLFKAVTLTELKYFDLCRLDEFMAGFNAISLKLKEMYQVCRLLPLCLQYFMDSMFLPFILKLQSQKEYVVTVLSLLCLVFSHLFPNFCHMHIDDYTGR